MNAKTIDRMTKRQYCAYLDRKHKNHVHHACDFCDYFGSRKAVEVHTARWHHARLTGGET